MCKSRLGLKSKTITASEILFLKAQFLIDSEHLQLTFLKLYCMLSYHRESQRESTGKGIEKGQRDACSNLFS